MFRTSNVEKWRTFAFAAAIVASLVAACSGQSSGSESKGPLSVALISSDIAIGEQRLAFGILNADKEPVIGAAAKVRILKVAGTTGTVIGEGEAHTIKVTQTYTDRHPDGKVETHTVGDVGVYAVYITFETAGDYGIEVSGRAGKEVITPIQLGFKVQPRTASVGIGQPAPRTMQPTVNDVTELSQIDSSDPPDPDMHRLTVVEAAASGRPTVVLFATPAFCTSRICGPMKQVVDGLYAKYKSQVNFIHIEPYDLAKARSGEGLQVVPFLAEWGLKTEPWVFILGADGRVAAKFEAAAAGAEIELPLQKLLGS